MFEQIMGGPVPGKYGVVDQASNRLIENHESIRGVACHDNTNGANMESRPYD